MFKFIKDFFGEWVIVPFESPGLTIICFVILGLLGVKFVELSGPGVILPLIIAFVVPLLLFGLFEKKNISTFWLCLVHGFFIRIYIDVVVKNAIKGNPQGLGLINLLFLFMLLLLAILFLIFLASDDGFIMFFIITITNALYFLSEALHEIPFVPQLVIWSTIIQIIAAAVSQVMISRRNKRNNKKNS